MSWLNRFVKTSRDILLYFLLILSAISYHPTIIRMSHLAGYESGTILSRYIVLLFGVVLLLSLNRDTLRYSKMIRKYFFWLFVIIIVGLMIMAFFDNRRMLNELRPLFMVLGATMIGYDFRLDKKKTAFLVLAFCLPTLYAGVMQVLINVGGFQIMDQYLTDSKNSLGAMLATASFSFYYLSRSFEKPFLRFASLALALLALVVVVTIRARMAMLSLFLVGMFYYFLVKRNNNFLIGLIVISIVVFFGTLLLPDSVFRYFENSFTAGTQGEDISSGRFSTYQEAIDYLSQHPFLGDIKRETQISWIHNYLLLKLYNFGVLFSWPILILFFTIVIRAIKNSLKQNPNSSEGFGNVCLLIPFLISLAEPTFPFGPGTVTVFNFIMFGAALKEIDSESLMG